MPLPFFYKEDITTTAKAITLDEDTSKHVVQVLRMQNGEQLQLTDGKGNLFTAEITDAHKKHCTVKVLTTASQQRPTNNSTIAISLVKNNSRFEWFLEKATEIGVIEIIPLICQRTEKQHFRYDRMKTILVSAMLQSQQTWLPVLHEPVKFENYIKAVQQSSNSQYFIAHCVEDKKQPLSYLLINSSAHFHICIGPEGDFTEKEIEEALQKNFVPVSLGETRLRTETAGIVAATLLVNLPLLPK
jgi:16S rRNA (uracil1498-N3)-methyltransferase